MPTKVDWMSAGKIDTLCTRARKMAPLTLGRKAPYLCLTDTTEQRWVNYYDLPQEFVVIIFWDPHCGHCKKELPDIYKAYQEKLKPMGIEVFAVAKAVEDKLFDDWKKFIRENKLDWINVGLTPTVFSEAKKDARKYIPEAHHHREPQLCRCMGRVQHAEGLLGGWRAQDRGQEPERGSDRRPR
ncbi:MAG: redoxin domain-containing protein [Flavobacteriales bacterium]|nr:redoxin domain-containing protein [Flavobacteriales bacterium]